MSITSTGYTVVLSDPTRGNLQVGGDDLILNFADAGDDSKYDAGKSSLKLLRRGARNYADIVSENLIHLTENFASTTSPAFPLQGQLWFDRSANRLKVWDVQSTWQPVGSPLASALATPVPIGVTGDVNDASVMFDGSVGINIPVNLKTISGLSAGVPFVAPIITVNSKGLVVDIAAGPPIPSIAGLAQDAVVVHKAGDTMTGSLTIQGIGANLNVVNGKVKEGGNDLVPAGGIIMWSGSAVPGGWKLCDGSNGTPNLTNRFIMGGAPGSTGGASSVTVTTGSAGDHSHTLTIALDGAHDHGSVTGDTALTTAQLPSHSHQLGSGVPIKGAGYGYSGSNGVTPGTLFQTNPEGGGAGHNHPIPSQAGHSHAGSIAATTGAHTHTVTATILPPYYTLAFIMKI